MWTCNKRDWTLESQATQGTTTWLIKDTAKNCTTLLVDFAAHLGGISYFDHRKRRKLQRNKS